MTSPTSSDPARERDALTSFHVRRARGGDAESLRWLVEKLAPLLLANARYRLGTVLGELYDPEDIVHDVWVVALPKLPELPSRDGRYTPVLLRFLATTLLYRVNNLVEKHIRGKPRRAGRGASDGPSSSAGDPVARLAADTTGAMSRMIRAEREDAVGKALARLEPRDRELVILRGVEGRPYKEVAVVLGRDPKVLAVEYQRALRKLRDKLPGSVFDELDLE